MFGEYDPFGLCMSSTYDKSALEAKGTEFCRINGTSLACPLGWGIQGVVLKTERNTAIKIYELKSGYERERNIYLRLRERDIQEVRGMVIPRLHKSDDSLLV